MIENTPKAIGMLLQKAEDVNRRIILNGDLNPLPGDWFDLETMKVKNNSNLWVKNVLEFMQDFFLHQLIQDFTRKRWLDELSILDLVCTRQRYDVENLIYNPPDGMSDHVLLEYNFLVAYNVLNEGNKERY